MPALGVAMTEGVLLNWLKASGDDVAKGEAIAEIETDKTTVEIESPSAGIVGSLLFEPGAIVPVGAPMTHIMEPGDAADADGRRGDGHAHRGRARGSRRGAGRSRARGSGRAHAEPPQPARADAGPRGGRGHRGGQRTGRLGRLRAGRLHPQHGRPRQRASIASSSRRRSPSRGTTIPHFGVTREVDATAMVRLRERWTARTDRPSFTDLMLRALALALRESGVAGPVDVGLAVATPQGVAIPVVRDVLALDLGALRRAREEAVDAGPRTRG